MGGGGIDFSAPLVYRTCFGFAIKYYIFISALYFAHGQCLPSFISGNGLCTLVLINMLGGDGAAKFECTYFRGEGSNLNALHSQNRIDR